MFVLYCLLPDSFCFISVFCCLLFAFYYCRYFFLNFHYDIRYSSGLQCLKTIGLLCFLIARGSDSSSLTFSFVRFFWIRIIAGCYFFWFATCSGCTAAAGAPPAPAAPAASPGYLRITYFITYQRFITLVTFLRPTQAGYNNLNVSLSKITIGLANLNGFPIVIPKIFTTYLLAIQLPNLLYLNYYLCITCVALVPGI